MKKLALALVLGLCAFALAQAQTTVVQPVGPQIVPIQASAQFTTGASSATLAAAAGKFTYLCGWVVTSGGTTSAANGDVAISGVQTTMHHNFVFVSSGQGVLGVAYPGCLPATAVNTAIVLNIAAGGAGTTGSISMWGYQN